jgi:CRP/FNR family transcriptional regulator, cyclic AMP receptor protein
VTTMNELLTSHRLFSGLAPAQIDFVTGCARNVAFAPGEFLFREGDPADTMYLVRRGHVSIDVHQPGHGPITIETVADGDTVGWSWIVAPYRWTFDARALDAVGSIALDAACLRDKTLQDPSFGVALLSLVAAELLRRLQATRLRLLDLYGGRREY